MNVRWDGEEQVPIQQNQMEWKLLLSYFVWEWISLIN